MAVEDRIMRDMLSNEDLDSMVKKYQEGGQVKKSLVPMPGEEGTQVVDPQMAESAEAASDRWGTDTPMFKSREDMHGFLQDLGMAPGAFGADMLDSMLYMTECELGDAMISMGAAVPIIGGLFTTGRKAAKVVRSGARERGRAEKFKKGLDKRMKAYTKEHELEQSLIARKLGDKEKIFKEGMARKKIVKQQPITPKEREIAEGWEKKFGKEVEAFTESDAGKRLMELLVLCLSLLLVLNSP